MSDAQHAKSLKGDEQDVDPQRMTRLASAASVSSVVRAQRVSRRITRRATGLTTRNYHRNERVKHVAFVVLAAGATLGGLVSALS